MTARLVVMISGNGSNLQAILDAIANKTLPAEVVLVVSNRKNAYGLERARNAGVKTLYFPLKPYTDDEKSREQYDADLAERIAVYAPTFIVLAGWMHILSAAFLDKFPRQVINLHPALPGEFAGMYAIERAYDAYQERKIAFSGCMIHYVIPEVDAGAAIATAEVPILDSDSLEDFEKRMHATEHQLLIYTLRSLISRKGG
ncbi:MAG: phosphoribosylglycinamide formyltransferase [Chloroflexi bacterium]|nr:phosphoribosylglycinamide formyltransferase [Chloroflexota bacterium]